MEERKSIFACYFQVGFNPELKEQDFQQIAGTFRPYIWGDQGIDQKLKKLKNSDYGKDVSLILFQFYVKPSEEELKLVQREEAYRKREKSIGIPIIVNDQNFFDKSEENRYPFLVEEILNKIDHLKEIVNKRKLDTNVDKLKGDLLRILT